ncbi:hypothetical protein TNCV_4281831 [Trichonephila clavipes]|nr:hypothetical protein TNCV_4281831 [Trichonephila clavipes]
MTNRGILLIILKRSVNPRTGKAHHHREPNLFERAIKIQSNHDYFSDIHGIVYRHWFPEHQTINHHYNLRVLTELRERLRKNRPEMGSPPRQCPASFRIVCQEVSCQV